MIDAAGRNAQLQQQAQEAGQQQLVQGLQSIGQIGQSLYDQKKRVAQSLALGRQFDVPDEVSRTMSPEQLLQVGTIKKGNVDMQMLMSMIHPGAFGNGEGATPASGTVPPKTNGPILASQTTATPLPDQGMAPVPSATSVPPPVVSTVPTPASIPVPIQAPPPRRTVNKATADAAIKLFGMNRPEKVMTSAEALAAGEVPKGTKIINQNTGNSDKKSQDKYWSDAVRGLQSIRGDTQLKDIETQRNAAISAFNRLSQVEASGKGLNPIDYVDVLGQTYKARTGVAPTQEVLKEAKQATAEGQFGKYWTYFTGKQMPATTKEIAGSLKDMVAHMGLQADDLHNGEMQVHGAAIFNPNMSEENKAKLSKLARGKSFAEATGVKSEDYDPHVQAIKWAQANPNDPRSAPILQKAMQSMQQGQQGQNVGL